MTHAEMFAGSQIVPGMAYRFSYPEEFETLDDYSAHRGENVVVLRATYPFEADVLWDDIDGDGNEQIVDRMFVVQAEDGWIGHAWESELLDP